MEDLSGKESDDLDSIRAQRQHKFTLLAGKLNPEGQDALERLRAITLGALDKKDTFFTGELLEEARRLKWQHYRTVINGLKSDARYLALFLDLMSDEEFEDYAIGLIDFPEEQKPQG